MKNVNKRTPVKVDFREEQNYMGIRTITQFAGMFAEVKLMLKELRNWVIRENLSNEGPFLLRYYTIDMKGEMDIEVGFIVNSNREGNERIKPNTLPSGKYASLIYSGGGYTGNKALLDWARENKVALDQWATPTGDAFRCRYEAYLTDYRIEPRKTLWDIELAIKIADQ